MYYKYDVLSETGSEIKGSMDGSLESIKKTLKEKNCYIISLKPDLEVNKIMFCKKKNQGSKPLNIF